MTSERLTGIREQEQEAAARILGVLRGHLLKGAGW